jgi:hypothetical protein
VLYKSESDVMMYVVGGVDENEIMLYNVILALRDSLHLLFKYVPNPPFHPLQYPHHPQVSKYPTLDGLNGGSDASELEALDEPGGMGA